MEHALSMNATFIVFVDRVPSEENIKLWLSLSFIHALLLSYLTLFPTTRNKVFHYARKTSKNSRKENRTF